MLQLLGKLSADHQQAGPQEQAQCPVAAGQHGSGDDPQDPVEEISHGLGFDGKDHIEDQQNQGQPQRQGGEVPDQQNGSLVPCLAGIT